MSATRNVPDGHADLLHWLAKGCSRLTHGQCTTRRCIIRGGYSGSGGYDPDIATCEEKERYDRLTRADDAEALLEALLKPYTGLGSDHLSGCDLDTITRAFAFLEARK